MRIKNKLRYISSLGLKCGPHITRYSMYSRLSQFSFLLQGCTNALSISDSEQLLRVMGGSGTPVTSAHYPDENFLGFTYPENHFDVVVSDQVLEHVEGCPRKAFNEALRVLRPGGIGIHTTCLINPIHNHPGDFWRFTPDALKLLAEGSSEVIECGSWGNFEAWDYIRDGFRYSQIPHARWHPLNRLATRNEVEWPIVTWIILRK